MAYNQFDYKEYLKSIENKVYKSVYRNSQGEYYYAYAIRHINKSSTKGLNDNCMICISMNHTKMYNPSGINNVVLNLIPLSTLKAATFKLEDYRYQNNDIFIQSDSNAPYITNQYENRPIKNLRLGFKSITNTVNNNINTMYKDLMFNNFTVFKYETHKETYCRDLINPTLVILGNVQDIYSGNLSFTKMISYDPSINNYKYSLYQNQNRLENVNGFNIGDYNEKVITVFGENNLEWSI